MEQEDTVINVDTSADQFPSILNVPDDDDDERDEEETAVYQSLLRNANNGNGGSENNAMDVIPEEFAPTTFNICPTFFTLVLYTIYFLGVCGGSIYILIQGKEPIDCTDQPLLLWIQVQIIILVFGLLVRVWTTLNEYKGITLDQRLTLCMRFQSKMAIFLQKVGNMFWCVWFLIGTVWTFKSQNCLLTKASPPIYIFCLTVVIINLFLIGLCILCCICTCVCIGFCYMINPESFRPDDVRGAPKKVIEKLETKKFSKGLEGLDDEDAKCAICLSNYEEGDELRYLPCKPKKHHYHRECVDEWLLLNKTCPFCKRPIDEEDKEETKTETSSNTPNPDTDNTLTAD